MVTADVGINVDTSAFVVDWYSTIIPDYMQNCAYITQLYMESI